MTAGEILMVTTLAQVHQGSGDRRASTTSTHESLSSYKSEEHANKLNLEGWTNSSKEEEEERDKMTQIQSKNHQSYAMNRNRGNRGRGISQSDVFIASQNPTNNTNDKNRQSISMMEKAGKLKIYIYISR
jgi:hypothetical protein